MRRLARLTVTWFLALALPVQGVLAVTLPVCGSAHGEHLGAQALSLPLAGASATHHAHRGDSDATAHAHAIVGDSKADEKKSAAKTGGHKCSACASCCLNAVVPTEAISFVALDLPKLFAPLVTRTPPAFLTEGLERPPRTFLA